MFIKVKNLHPTGRLAACLLLLLFLIAGAFGCDPSEERPGCGPTPTTKLLPVVFVHGMAGSAEQFALQAQRFASNGYPNDYISGFEYDTTMKHNTLEEIMASLDAHIDAVLAETGVDKVDLAGHSMGTMMSQRYLSNSKRAAKVAHYVNIDGMPRPKRPLPVPTLAVWAAISMIDGEREVIEGTNVFLPGQTHVQSCTSAESFAEMYKFFTGKKPKTVKALPEDGDMITLAGQLNYFMTNLIPENYAIEIYKVDPDTGARISEKPLHTQAIGADGGFEFSGAVAGQTYEFATHSPDHPNMTQHTYAEAYVRSNLLIRLLISEPGSALDNLVVTSAEHTNMTITRDKELIGNSEEYTEHPLFDNDSLTINGEELCSPATMPSKSASIGIYILDAGLDGQSDISIGIEDFSSIPFVSGIDMFLEASSPATDVISIELNGRQGSGRPQVINVPNLDSATNKISVKFEAL